MHSIPPGLSEKDSIHQYKLGGHNIVIDIASGAVHSVDDVVYDVIGLYGADNLEQQIKQKHPNVTDADIRAMLIDIEKLIKDGKLFTPDTFATVAGKNATSKTRHVKALCLNVSHECNMSCAYCFACASFEATENKLMSFTTGKSAVDFLIANSGEHKTLDIDFFGGEPLLNWKVVKEIVAYAQMAAKFVNKKFRFTLTTNGLLIDEDVIAFTNRHFYNVVLSIDGRPETHDKMRKLNDGESSYKDIVPKIKELVKQRRGKGYYIRGTFTRENMDFANDILHIADELGFMEISLEPVVAKPYDKIAFTRADLPELFKQYDILAIEMQRRKENAKYVRASDIPPGSREFNFYHFNLDLEHSPCIYKRIKGCGAGTEYLAVTPDGELYPCHQFIGEKEFLLGNVSVGVVNKTLQSKFASESIFSKSECKSCWARYYCSGGCAANAYHATGSISGVYDIGCQLFKKRIENALMLQF